MGIVMLDDNEYKELLYKIGLQQFAYAIPAELEILIRQECNEIFTTLHSHYIGKALSSEIHFKGKRLGKLTAADAPYNRTAPSSNSFQRVPIIFSFSTYSSIEECWEYKKQFDVIMNDGGGPIPYTEYAGDLVITSHLGDWVLTTTLKRTFITEMHDYPSMESGFHSIIINAVYRLMSDHVQDIKFDINKVGEEPKPEKQEVETCKPSTPSREPFRFRRFIQRLFGISH